MTGLYMFSGSSSVGKTTTLNKIRDKVDFRLLTARTVREQFGNPSWTDIIADRNLADKLQMAQLEYFLQQLEQVVTKEAHLLRDENAKPIVFERSPWDVVGYSYAFKCSGHVIDEQHLRLIDFEDRLIDNGFETNLVYFHIDGSYLYELIPERPPEEIRIDCAKALQWIWQSCRIPGILADEFVRHAVMEIT